MRVYTHAHARDDEREKESPGREIPAEKRAEKLKKEKPTKEKRKAPKAPKFGDEKKRQGNHHTGGKVFLRAKPDVVGTKKSPIFWGI